MKNKFLTLPMFLIFIVNTCFAIEKCPYPVGAVEVDIDVKTSKTEDNKYRYSYSIKNISTSQLSIFWFFVEANEASQIKSPSKWKVLNLPTSSHKGFIQWTASTAKDGIAVGQTLKGFEFESNLPPGSSIAKVRGLSSDKKFTEFDRKEDTFCPGFWDLGSSSEDDPMARYLSVGPISPKVVSPITYVNLKNSNWKKNSEKSKVSISPIDNGELEIILIGNEDFNINDLDFSSLSGGRKNVQPKKVQKLKTLPAVISNQKASKLNYEHLSITFDLEHLNILCDVDRALIVNGVLKNGKILKSGIHLNYTPCNPGNWVKEVPKIKFRQGL